MKAKCRVCGTEFLADRRTAKFCSSKHRLVYHRRKQSLDDNRKLAVQAIHQIEAVSQQFPEFKAFGILMSIREAALSASERVSKLEGGLL